MSKRLYEIPTVENFLKGLEKIKSQQLEARESSTFGMYPFPGTNNEYDYFPTGIITPKGKHYSIDSEGDLSFTGTKYLTYEDKEAFPPFSAADLLLESRNDFKIDYAEAVKYYNLNKELAMKENENILSSKEFQPVHPFENTVNQEIKEVKNILEEQGLDPSKNPEVSALLDQHFSKLEKLINDFSEKIEKASQEDLPQLEETMKGKLNKIFIDLKDSLKQLFVDMKDQVRSGIESKIDDIKINVHNVVAEKVQNVNDKIKDFTTTLDKKYQIIEKGPVELQNAPIRPSEQKDNLQVGEVLSQSQKGLDEVKKVTNTETKAIKDSEVTNAISKHEMSPEISDLEKQHKQLSKENEGLKTFVNVVKSQHPEVYQAIYNTMKNVQHNEEKNEQIEVKSKVKEEVELSI